ncbi:MAG: hypothetical protein GTO54_03340 [Nitrososphaeria archaeon]|nr:hypothetical protein [Nitrososphaeria archaeon]
MTKAGKTVEGTVNRLIDALMHPYFEDHPALIVVDGLLHAFFEQDPEITLMHACGRMAGRYLSSGELLTQSKIRANFGCYVSYNEVELKSSLELIGKDMKSV